MTAQKYVKNIVKKIKSSRSKRLEIKNQLQSDIAAAMEQGETLDVVVNRMGTPSEVAAEFNANFSEAEQKSFKRLATVKVICLTVAVVLCLLGIFIWWSIPKSYEFGTSGKYDAGVVEEKAKQVILLFNAADYEALREMCDETMKRYTTEDNLEPVKDLISEDWGAFESFGSVYMIEMQQMNLKGVVVQVSALYENVGVNYVISFDEDMRLIGMVMR